VEENKSVKRERQDKFTYYNISSQDKQIK